MADNVNLPNAAPNIVPPPPSPLPEGMVYIGIVVGALITLGGFFYIFSSALQMSPGYLAICVGFGIILAAFGARAIGRFGDWTVAGCGAVAIVLYLILIEVPAPIKNPFVVVHLRNTEKMQSVFVNSNRNILVGRPGASESYNMLVFQGDIIKSGNYFDVTFQNEPTKDPKEFTIGCVGADTILDLMSSGGEAIYALRDAGDVGNPKFVIDDVAAQKTFDRDRKGCDAFKQPATASIRPDFHPFGFFTSAYAADGSLGSINDALPLLESDSPQQRDAARDYLAKLTTPEEWAAVTSSWNISQSTYRADLGRLVSWVTAIHQDRANAVAIGRSIPDDQFSYILQLAGYGDSTMRSWATELVSWLLQASSWPQGLTDKTKVYSDLYSAALSSATATPQKRGVAFDVNNRIYNLMVAAQYSGCATAPSLRSGAISTMAAYKTDSSYGPKVRQMASDVGKSLSLCN